LPPPQKAAPPKSTLPPKTTTPPATKPSTPANYQSGLSAAFAPNDHEMSLGALEDGALLKLAAVDGADDSAEAAPAAAFEPPVSASIGSPPAKPSAAKAAAAKPAAKPKDEPLDMFAPPDAESDDFKVELAADDAAELNARKRASTPPPTDAGAPALESAPAVAGRYSRPSLQVPNAEASSGQPRAHPLASPRVRLVLGVVIAIVLGFVPATLVASSREKSAFAMIDTKIVTTQNQADTPDAYATLDTFRAEQLSRKYDEQRSITITALLIWAAVGAAAAYVWFKRVPWQRFES
jgi:hypothetical protein